MVKQENAHVGLVLDDRFDHESALNVFFRSDQFPFVLHNVPAFWWFTGFHPDYHHITDTVEKIDYVKMMKILDLAYLSAWRFANDANHTGVCSEPDARGCRAKEGPLMFWMIADGCGDRCMSSMTPIAVVCWAAWLGWLPLEGTWAFWTAKLVSAIVFTVLAVGEWVGDTLPVTPKPDGAAAVAGASVFRRSGGRHDGDGDGAAEGRRRYPWRGRVC